jgi:hypothetical protein
MTIPTLSANLYFFLFGHPLSDAKHLEIYQYHNVPTIHPIPFVILSDAKNLAPHQPTPNTIPLKATHPYATRNTQ